MIESQFLEDLRKHYPNSDLTVLCKKPLGTILIGNPYINDLIEFQKRKGFQLYPLDA